MMKVLGVSMLCLMLKVVFVFSMTWGSLANAQKSEREAIEALDFLVGSWAGPGISYGVDNSQTKYHDTEYVRFDLDKKLLLINARGERNKKTTYALHTVVYYDVAAGHYWYTPYSGKKPRRFKCDINNRAFVCLNKTHDFRLTFQRLEDGRWNEYGERYTHKKWNKTFETILLPKK